MKSPYEPRGPLSFDGLLNTPPIPPSAPNGMSDKSGSNSPTGISRLIEETLAGTFLPSIDNTDTFLSATTVISHDAAASASTSSTATASTAAAIAAATHQVEVKPEPVELKSVPGLLQWQADVPSCLLFGPTNDRLEHIINRNALTKLPPYVLSRLVDQGQRQGSIVTIEDGINCESMIRLKQFLEIGSYRPFKPKTALEYVETGGAIQSWIAPKDNRNAVNVTATTQELFDAEIDLYRFSIALDYAELRRVSAENICSKYPKSVRGIWSLVDKVFLDATGLQDAKLTSHIIDLVNSNCTELTKLPQFLPKLRRLTIAEPPLGPLLMESYFSASEAARRRNIDIQKKELRSGGGGGSSSNSSSKIRESPSASATSPTEPSQNPLLAQIPKFAEAITRGNLAIALDDGYGTLVRGDLASRNQDFKFVQGELLLADYLKSAINGRNNIVVYNSKGERGDILKTLVRTIPVGFGILKPGQTVNSAPHASPERDARSTKFPDREHRTYPPSVRSRSRSPTLRY